MELQLSSIGNSQRREDPEFSLREWGLKARMISRDNTISRRFSAGNITSFREDSCNGSSFRSNFTVSSTASSPGFGYTLKEEIDPSMYSFTNALKALQLRSINTWEYLSPEETLTLNSKWNDAEKYISNPLSGEVPMECLSAKTLSGRSFKSLTNRITMSAPLIYPSNSHSRQFANIPIQEKSKEKGNNKTRDVGTQSTPPEFTSSSPSPASTPPIQERSIKCNLALQAAATDSSNSSSKSKCDDHIQHQEEVKEAEEETKRNEDESNCRKEKKANNQNYVGMCRQAGCFSLRNLWTRTRQREKHKPRNKNCFFTRSKAAKK